MNLLGTSSLKSQQKAWSNIVENYYRDVDEDSFNSFLKDRRKDVAWDCDLAIMQCSFTLASLGVDSGYAALASIGIKGDLGQIRRKINAKITNHELKSKPQKDGEAIDFFKMLAKIRKQGYSVDSNITLQEWVGVLNDIKETNERNNSKE